MTSTLEARTRATIHVDNPNAAVVAIREALRVAGADLFVNEDGHLISHYDGHFWELDVNSTQIECGVCPYLTFRKGNKQVPMPRSLGKAFVKRALAEGWYPKQVRGTCPGCRWRLERG